MEKMEEEDCSNYTLSDSWTCSYGVNSYGRWFRKTGTFERI